jgi:hypothetical protein
VAYPRSITLPHRHPSSPRTWHETKRPWLKEVGVCFQISEVHHCLDRLLITCAEPRDKRTLSCSLCRSRSPFWTATPIDSTGPNCKTKPPVRTAAPIILRGTNRRTRSTVWPATPVKLTGLARDLLSGFLTSGSIYIPVRCSGLKGRCNILNCSDPPSPFRRASNFPGCTQHAAGNIRGRTEAFSRTRLPRSWRASIAAGLCLALARLPGFFTGQVYLAYLQSLTICVCNSR